MDTIDHALVAALRENARMTIAALAKRLRVARGTVQSRLRRLESDGIIVGYTVRLRPQVEEPRIRALMTIEVGGNRPEAAIVKALRGDPAVTALYSTNGRWDYIAELRAEHLEEFDRVLGRIRQVEGIVNTQTNLLLTTYKF
jgi:DNA-binding Lrp family transcriptional regulator